MSEGWQPALKRWRDAGIVDTATAERIREFESSRGGMLREGRLALIVFALGALLLIAGALLFIAAHWDSLGPGGRFAIVLAAIAALHAGGAAAAARGSSALSATLHAVGTGVFGAGIYLAGQVFHMAEHWPTALLLWAAGAAVAVYWLRQWPQALWLAVLAPAWLWGEWMAAHAPDMGWRDLTPAALGLFLLACAYLMARPADSAERWRRALAWLGAIALVPAAVALAMAGDVDQALVAAQPEIAGAPRWIAWAVAIGIPLALAWRLRGREAVWMAAALAWALLLARVSPHTNAGELAMYALLGIGAVGVVLWGLRDGQRLAVNVGVLGFALAMLGFYFASLYDRLGRALGLIGLGVLFIGGGWLLERARRRLLARLPERRP